MRVRTRRPTRQAKRLTDDHLGQQKTRDAGSISRVARRASLFRAPSLHRLLQSAGATGLVGAYELRVVRCRL